eukprot:Nk52_evm35s158 gene=Nk52_evmTU35s158
MMSTITKGQKGLEDPTGGSTVKVAIRVRPLIPREIVQGQRSCVQTFNEEQLERARKTGRGPVIGEKRRSDRRGGEGKQPQYVQGGEMKGAMREKNEEEEEEGGGKEDHEMLDEDKEGETGNEHVFTKNSLVLGKKKLFHFDSVLPPKTSQTEVYDLLILPLIEKCFQGYNSTVFAYGQTGSGKTHTMFGPALNNPNHNDHDPTQNDYFVHTNDGVSELDGIIPRAVEEFFNIIEASKYDDEGNMVGSPIEYHLKLSYLEIYFEEIIDLLATPPSSNNQSHETICIREDKAGKTQIFGATQERVHSKRDLCNLILKGNLRKKTAKTKMNDSSSRSHSIVTFTLEQYPVTKHNTENKFKTYTRKTNSHPMDGVHLELEKVSKFHFVDLAGSERAERTGNVGTRFKESIMINTGLLALGNVISSLSKESFYQNHHSSPNLYADSNSSNGLRSKSGSHIHIPYRESKLTRMLKDSLGGNSLTLMICCLSPSDANLNENLNVLKYANRAKNIKNIPVINFVHHHDYEEENEMMKIEAEKKNQEKCKRCFELEDQLRNVSNYIHVHGSMSVETFDKIIQGHELGGINEVDSQPMDDEDVVEEQNQENDEENENDAHYEPNEVDDLNDMYNRAMAVSTENLIDSHISQSSHNVNLEERESEQNNGVQDARSPGLQETEGESGNIVKELVSRSKGIVTAGGRDGNALDVNEIEWSNVEASEEVFINKAKYNERVEDRLEIPMSNESSVKNSNELFLAKDIESENPEELLELLVSESEVAKESKELSFNKNGDNERPKEATEMFARKEKVAKTSVELYRSKENGIEKPAVLPSSEGAIVETPENLSLDKVSDVKTPVEYEAEERPAELPFNNEDETVKSNTVGLHDTVEPEFFSDVVLSRSVPDLEDEKGPSEASQQITQNEEEQAVVNEEERALENEENEEEIILPNWVKQFHDKHKKKGQRKPQDPCSPEVPVGNIAEESGESYEPNQFQLSTHQLPEQKRLQETAKQTQILSSKLEDDNDDLNYIVQRQQGVDQVQSLELNIRLKEELIRGLVKSEKDALEKVKINKDKISQLERKIVKKNEKMWVRVQEDLQKRNAVVKERDTILVRNSLSVIEDDIRQINMSIKQKQKQLSTKSQIKEKCSLIQHQVQNLESEKNKLLVQRAQIQEKYSTNNDQVVLQGIVDDEEERVRYLKLCEALKLIDNAISYRTQIIKMTEKEVSEYDKMPNNSQKQSTGKTKKGNHIVEKITNLDEAKILLENYFERVIDLELHNNDSNNSSNTKDDDYRLEKLESDVLYYKNTNRKLKQKLRQLNSTLPSLPSQITATSHLPEPTSPSTSLTQIVAGSAPISRPESSTTPFQSKPVTPRRKYRLKKQLQQSGLLSASMSSVTTLTPAQTRPTTTNTTMRSISAQHQQNILEFPFKSPIKHSPVPLS